MAHSLELRVPFLDPEVMKVAARLAPREKVCAHTTKVALRQAMQSVLPKPVTERAKLGFPVPIGHWLTGEAGEFAHRVLSEAQTDEWINRAAALRLLQRFRAGRHDVSWRQVWVLTVFSLWHQIYLEQLYDPVALGWETPPKPAKTPVHLGWRLPARRRDHPWYPRRAAIWLAQCAACLGRAPMPAASFASRGSRNLSTASPLPRKKPAISSST